MKTSNRKIIYDGINMSVRALTVFIIIGLLIMAGLIWYGTLKGTFGNNNIAPTRPNDQSYIEVPHFPAQPCFHIKDGCMRYKSLHRP